jgi:hypothetical protein
VSSASFTSARGFFFAAMIAGSAAKRTPSLYLNVAAVFVEYTLVGATMRRSTVTTAGSFTRSVITPPSTSRPTSRAPASSRTVAANVAIGQSSSSARIWPTWFESPSTACLPITTTSGFSRSTSAARARATRAPSSSVVGDVDADGAIGAGGEGSAERGLALLRAERHDHDLPCADLRGLPVLGEAEGRLQGVLIEGVGLPFEARRLDLVP